MVSCQSNGLLDWLDAFNFITLNLIYIDAVNLSILTWGQRGFALFLSLHLVFGPGIAVSVIAGLASFLKCGCWHLVISCFIFRDVCIIHII